MTDQQWKKERAEVRQLWIASEKRWAEGDKRWAAADKRAAQCYEKIDRRLAATSKLLKAGAKVLGEIRSKGRSSPTGRSKNTG